MVRKLVIYSTCIQGKYCKGKCIRIKQGRPIGNPYQKGFVRCTYCDAWFKIENTKEGKGYRCDCCNMRVKTKVHGRGLKNLKKK